MPRTFQDREQAFEAQFAREEEFRFLLQARRDKLFAQWAATQLGLSSEESARLVAAVLAIADGPGHDQAVLRHIAALPMAHPSGTLEENLSAALERCSQQARQQLTTLPPDHSDVL